MAGFDLNLNAPDSLGLGAEVGHITDFLDNLIHPGNDNQLLQQQLDAANQQAGMYDSAQVAIAQSAADVAKEKQKNELIAIIAISTVVLIIGAMVALK